MFGIIALWAVAFLGGAALGAVAGVATRNAANRPVVITTVAASVIFAVALVGIGIWAARCPRCLVGTQNSRSEALFFMTYFYGIALASGLAGLWAASALGGKLRRATRGR